MRRLLALIKKFIIIIIALVIVFLLNGIIEYAIVQNKIDSFKNRGIQYDYHDNTKTYYYKVKKEYDYEDITRNIMNPDNNWLGSKTDIFITSRNPMRDVPEISWIMSPLSKYFYLGHASINITDDGSRIIEVFGNSSNPENNVVAESLNTWHISDEDTPNVIGLRIKGTSEEQRNKIVDYAKSKIDYSYNYTFLFNRSQSFYCTDLVSRAAASAGINLNYDYLATTGNDLIANRHVYIIYYRELVYENGIPRYNIYHLEED